MSASPPATGKVARRWPPSQLALAFVLGVLTVLLAERAIERLLPARPSALLVPEAAAGLPAASHRLDLNLATSAELEALPGIGPGLAQRIVGSRPYASVDDLGQVPGLGPTGVAQLKPFLYVSRNSPDRQLAKGRIGAAPAPVDLNLATAADLQRLPGIGPVLAERILADRTAKGPYRRVDDLMRVKGIKQKTLERLLPYVVVDQKPPAAGNVLRT